MSVMMVVWQEFTVCGDMLERVKVFKYLGRWLSITDDDAHTIHIQLAKACRVWARVSTKLQGENTLLRVCRMVYRASMQSIMLYGIKSWEICLALLVWLKGFHIRAVWQIAPEHRQMRGASQVWE